MGSNGNEHMAICILCKTLMHQLCISNSEAQPSVSSLCCMSIPQHLHILFQILQLQNSHSALCLCRCVCCVQCGSSSPGFHCEWQNNYLHCGPCASLVTCPVCRENFMEEELLLQCQHCDRWVLLIRTPPPHTHMNPTQKCMYSLNCN